ncbi:MAG: hypothetical protein JEZ05_00105 [Tenericutes bacterium]|nr:hypothetical protein [Mycoplasmatota bacterium]
MDKNDKDIRKEIEELEKLIDRVKKQNEEERKKYTKKPKGTIVKINLASVYSHNFWVNMIFSFLINFIVIFSILKLFNFALITDDTFIIYIVFIFTVLEEFYRKYLFTKQVKIVLFTSGLIFTLINIVIFYLLDIFVFSTQFSFNSYLDPIAFVILFQVIRAFIKNVYVRINSQNALRKIKRKR